MRIFAVFALAAAVCTASAATLTAGYDFSGNLNDSLGGPALNSQGGTVNATSYIFGGNQGLNVSGVLANAGDYSIEMRFRFDTVSGYRKVIDFRNRTSDKGLYVQNGTLRFFDYTAAASTVFSANQTIDVVLTRNAATGVLAGYVNGVQQFSYNDAAGQLGVFNPGTMRFFQDDSGSEYSAGVADRIVIYDGALTTGEVADIYSAGGTELPNAVPEPSSMLLAAAGLGLLSVVRRR